MTNVRFSKGKMLCGAAGIAAALTIASPAFAQNVPVDGNAGRSQDAGEANDIVVTAQKREQRVQDVPIPVTVVNTSALSQSSQLSIRDYYTQIPGLSISPGLQSTTLLSIRGITTGGGTNPTVGVMIDDVPYGAATSLGQGNVLPDIDPGELERIEVLRGPQGTLYGASSMGGLIKFVTRDPTTDAVSGRFQAGIATVQEASQLGYNLRGSVNLPLANSVAVRLGGFYRSEPGYIDNPNYGERNVNSAEAWGGRGSLLWRLSDDVTLRLSALVQRNEGDGAGDVDVLPGLGDLEQQRYPGTGWYDRKIQAYSGTLSAKLGVAELTAVTGYSINSYRDSFDYTYALGPVAVASFGPSGVALQNDSRVSKFSQELRLRVPIGERVDWLVGGLYTNEKTALTQSLDAVRADGDVLGNLGFGDFPTRYKEYAAFTNLTLHLTDTLDVQFGARESHVVVTNEPQTTSGFLLSGSPTLPRIASKSDPFTYLASIQYRPNRDLMIYGRIASGYRPGGPNVNPILGTPASFAPDRTVNYEIGVKGDLLEGALTLDASVYNIAWSDIQVSLRNPQTRLTYKTNGGDARSRGFEVTATAKPFAGSTISGWLAYTDATLRDPFPAGSTAVGVRGDRLPNTPRWSANIAIDQRVPLSSNLEGFLGATLSYVGDRVALFRSVAQRQDLPSYAKLDLRAGLDFNNWRGTFFINNVTDKRGLLNGGLSYDPPYAFVYIPPRSIGFTLERRF